MAILVEEVLKSALLAMFLEWDAGNGIRGYYLAGDEGQKKGK